MSQKNLSENVRKRTRQIFDYLQEFVRMGKPPIVQVDEHQWRLDLSELPNHRAVVLDFATASAREAEVDDKSAESDAAILTVRRPPLHAPPNPPEDISDWLERGWEKWPGTVRRKVELPIKTEEGETVMVLFEDDENRVAVYESWIEIRDRWVDAERPAREAFALYERLYSLRTLLEREEEVELVLGGGLLVWRLPEGGVAHPLIETPLRLEFEAELPEIRLYQDGAPPRLVSELFVKAQEVDGGFLAERGEIVREELLDLTSPTFETFLRDFAAKIHAQGEYCATRREAAETMAPRIFQETWLYVRSTQTHYDEAIKRIQKDLEREDVEVPASIVHLTGGDPSQELARVGIPSRGAADGHGADLFMTLPANDEQERILRGLGHSGAILVQGPPGTGKTHTIANTIGHLLALGLRVLVTSHTTKSLTVLRDKVAEPLQPLCLSVLGDGRDALSDLQASVSSIVQRMAETEVDREEDIARTREAERVRDLRQLHELRAKLQAVVRAQYDDLVTFRGPISPTDAARWMEEAEATHGWIPESVDIRSSPPLTDEELDELYILNAQLYRADQEQVEGDLPDLDSLPESNAFAAGLNLIESVGAPGDHEIRIGVEQADGVLTSLSERLDDAARQIERREPWRRRLIEAGFHGHQMRSLWDELFEVIGSVSEIAEEARASHIRHEPKIAADLDHDFAVEILEELTEHVEATGKAPGFLKRMNPRVKRVLAAVSVRGNRPQTEDEFRALAVTVDLERRRGVLLENWRRTVEGSAEGPGVETLGVNPERSAGRMMPGIKSDLDWARQVWDPLQAELRETGVDYDAEVNELDAAHFEDDLDATSGVLGGVRQRVLPLIRGELERRRRDRIAARFEQVTSYLDPWRRHPTSHVGRALLDAWRQEDVKTYERLRKDLERLLDMRRRVRRRRELLDRLAAVSPKWTALIDDREALHGEEVPPGQMGDAWYCAGLRTELDRREAEAPAELQKRIDVLEARVRIATIEIVSRRAWAGQKKSVTPEANSALQGWLKTIKKIGSGTGKRVPALLREARKNLEKAQEAVPVWIMPLARVAREVDPTRTRFDVVIIDEASQCDVRGLVALYAGRTALVVGDDEQVSPSGIGTKSDEIEHIIGSTLNGIPQSHLYDEKNSIYDLAQVSFHTSVIRLVEHFRCVPAIIQYSNELCYEGKLRSLREDSGVRTRPFVVSHRIRGLRDGKAKRNHPEAVEVAALIAGMLELPEYEGKSIGIISMLGADHQADLVGDYLRGIVSDEIIAERRIIWGAPAQFQGDERDIIFLSLVDSPKDGPLRLTADKEAKKRFNVAASRARDQLVVVHSLDYKKDLKPDDLRFKLLRHAEEYAGREAEARIERELCESPFEEAVYDRLVAAGYAVRCQWEVGAYRIDLVAEGPGGSRVAIECDGDRYHRDKVDEDLARQRVLERLGWRFIRIRGTRFFRDPDDTMSGVIGELRRLGVEAGGSLVEASVDELDSEPLLSRLLEASESYIDQILAEYEVPGFPWRVESESPVATSDHPDVGGQLPAKPASRAESSEQHPATPSTATAAIESTQAGPDDESIATAAPGVSDSAQVATGSQAELWPTVRDEQPTLFGEQQRDSDEAEGDEDQIGKKESGESTTAVVGDSSESGSSDPVTDVTATEQVAPRSVEARHGADAGVEPEIDPEVIRARIATVVYEIEHGGVVDIFKQKLSEQMIRECAPIAEGLIEGLPGTAFKAIAGWAKQSEELRPYYRRFAYDIGRQIEWGQKLTPKQVVMAGRTLVYAVKAGFREVPRRNEGGNA